VVLGLVACAIALLPTPVPYPRWFDPDDASQGIFVNDLSFHGDYDASFEGALAYQDVYRGDWAAQRLSYSLPLSALQRALGIARHDVETLLTAAAVTFALAMCTLAALFLTPRQSGFSRERLAIVGIAVVHPSLILFARTGASFYLLAAALFWATMFAALRYAETSHSGWLIAAAISVGLFTADPYPPLAALPVALVFGFAATGRLGATLRDRRVIAATGSALALAAAVTAGLGLVFDGSAWTFAERVLAFQGERSASLGLGQLTQVSPVDKLVKWGNQHFLFVIDGLGDPTRGDQIWTLNAYHIGFLALFPVMVFGALRGLRERDPSTRLAVSVIGAFAVVFMTVSFPEGRYTLALVPCYAALFVRGLREVTGEGRAYSAALGAVLVLLSFETQLQLARVYEPRSEAAWRAYDGLRELAPTLSDHAGRRLRVRMPNDPDYAMKLYFRMVMDPAWRWLPADRFDATLERRPNALRVVVVDAGDGAAISRWRDLGFVERLRIDADRRLVVLQRPQGIPASPGGQGAST
jgi:hypothetical protein